MSNRRRRRTHPPWWKEANRRFEVYHGSEFSYLVHFPRWGPPSVQCWCPRSWGLRTPTDFVQLYPKTMETMMRKPPKNPNGPAAAAGSPDDMIERWPVLAEYLTATAYDGEPAGSRQTSTMLVFCQDGTWRVVLRDRQEARCLWVSSLGWSELLDVLENCLNDENAVWREDRASGAEQAKRQQKPK